jgi:hypothetical protein
MNLQDFITARPFLYHLTSDNNYPLIIADRILYSTNQLIHLSGNSSYQNIGTAKRFTHQEIFIGDQKYMIRDQQPVSEIALSKCLTNGWTNSDFFHHLNDRVFMWPTLDRLRRHFKRYAAENPVILRFDTRAILNANPHVKFCRLNSGATRPNSYLGGVAPARGQESFLPANLYQLPIGTIAEVTFEQQCNLIGNIWQSSEPEDVFQLV